jgi:signal transduction histidine kinase
VSDIATNPLWDVPEHRRAALKHGLRASWSNPVLSSKGEVLGTFCMYCREARTPTAQDLELIELATHLIRVAIERDRAQEAVRASGQVARGQVDALMQSLDVLATAPAPDKFLGQMLLNIRRQLQASRVLLWLRSEPDDALRLRLAVEGEQQVPEDPEHPLVKEPHGWKTISIFEEMLFSTGPVVCEETEHDARLGDAMSSYLTRKGIRKFLIVPVLVMGEVRGFIGIQHTERDPYRAEEIELAQALAHQVMLAIRLTQLAEQGRHAAILEERTRMARDIHDTLAQGFTGVIVQMEAAEEAFVDEAPDDAIQHVRRARELARESLGEARRSVHALRPQALEKAGFCDALKYTIRNPTIGTSLRSEFQVEGDVRELPPSVEENLLHIGQEALTNALKHARATRFETRLCFESDAVRLELSDNGEGFIGEAANGGFGLIGMRERAEQIGGTLRVTSARGKGTMIVAVAPYQEEGSR